MPDANTDQALGHARENKPESPGSYQIVSSSSAMLYSSPLPPAAELERLEKLAPGATGRILSMVENQQQHRFALENAVVPEQINQASRGQWFAFALGAIGAIGGMTMGFLGQPWLGGVIATVCVGNLALAFITGKKQEKSSRQRKAQGQPEI